MDGFLIQVITDECKFRGRDFSNELIKKIQEIMNEVNPVTRTDVKEEEAVDIDIAHDKSNPEVSVEKSDEESDSEESDEESDSDESETESVSSGGMDRIYNVKSFTNNNLYNVVYDCKKKRYICTCKDFKYHCDERNLMCKHIQKIDEFYEKGESIEMYLNNGIEIIK